MSNMFEYEHKTEGLSDLELAVKLFEHIEITQITLHKLTELWCNGSILENEARKRINSDTIPYYIDLDELDGQDKVALRRLQRAQIPGLCSLIFLFNQHRLQQSLYPIRNVGHKMVEVITEYIKGLSK